MKGLGSATLVLASLTLAACGADEPAGAEAGAGADVAADPGADAVGAEDSASPAEDVAAPDPDVAAPDPDVAAPDAGPGEDVAAPVEVPPWGVALTPDELAATYVFGITSDPMSMLSLVGGAVAGVSPVTVMLDVADGVAKIRIVDSAGTPIPSDVGVVEAYPTSELEDGRTLIDLRAPVASLEVQLYAACTYALVEAAPAGDPVHDAGLITWPMQETYESTGSCSQGGLQKSDGVNVHFLRRADANPAFEPRTASPDVPFGFFMAGDPTGQLGSTTLDRLPLPADASGNGTIVYHVSKDVPDELLPAVDAVFDGWNDVVETVTGVRPLSWQVADDDIIPWDPRYRSISWDKTQVAGAVAPFVSDPVTGEMFGTSVILWMGDIQLLVASYVEFLEQHPDAPWLGYDDARLSRLPAQGTPLWLDGPADLGDGSSLPPRVLRRHVFEQRTFGFEVVRDTWLKLGQSMTTEELTLEVVAEFLVHEIGHNFGLRHNFKGSIDSDGHGPDEPSSTVMDYVIGMGRPGQYDLDAIRYAYGPGAERTDYLYCTDEDVTLDPGCARWDFGHPLVFALDQYDAIAASVPASQNPQQVSQQSKQQGWNETFNHLRDFVNSQYEAWDPELPVDTFTEMLDRVLCAGACTTNPWLRGRLVDYLLRTEHKGWGFGGGTPVPYPALDEEQATALLGSLDLLVKDDGQPLYLRTAIVDRLGGSKVPGAGELLTTLQEHFAAIAEPSEDQAAVIDAIADAIAGD